MTLPRIYIGENTATKVSVSWSIDLSKVKAAFLAYVCNDASDRIEGSREGAMPTRILRTCWRGGAFAWRAGNGRRRFPLGSLRFPFFLRKIPGVFVMFRMRFDLVFFCPLTELDGSEKQ